MILPQKIPYYTVLYVPDYCTISTDGSRVTSEKKLLFIRLKSKEILSAISVDFFLKIVNDWSK